ASTTKQPTLSTTEVTPITSAIVKKVSNEDNDFNIFVDRLKNILSKPREEKQTTLTTTTSSVSAKSENEEVTTTKDYVKGLEVKKEKKPKKTQNYVEELEKVKDAVQIEKEDTKITEIKKLIEDHAEKYIKKALIMSEYAGGGGTNAVQYAEGGTMDGDLNVNGNYLSGGVNLLDIFALQPDLDNQTLSYNESNYDLSISNGNTVNLSSINTTFNANSGKYETTFTWVSSNSARFLLDLPLYVGVETENSGIRGTYVREPYIFPGGSPPPGSLPFYYTKINDTSLIVQPSRNIVWMGLSGRWEIINTTGPTPGYTIFAFCSGTPDQIPSYFWSTLTSPLTDIRITIQDKSYYDIANTVYPLAVDAYYLASNTTSIVNSNSSYWESAIQTVNGTADQIVATSTGIGNHDNQVTLSFAQSAVFPGDVLIPGTLTVTGTATYINTKNLIVDDPIIFLANNNAGNLVDTGFVSHFKLGPPLNNTHTGLVRRANQGVPGYWTLFSGLTTEPLTAVNIDWADSNIRLDTLSANIATNNGTSDQWNSNWTTTNTNSG
ncbi:hypothetical protein EBU71_17760, partial [bacterium]|nr:hypothetical protein [Candidatus Elulimicrobium humile]